MHIQGIHTSHFGTAAVSSASDGGVGGGPAGSVSGVGGPAAGGAGGRSTPLRVDAQRNLEHVLRAAREVFGELGYGAPMEDVARRARVGVGTVYRRFPSKDVLVRRIAEEETARLTEQARSALGQENEPWAALSRFLRTSVASGAGRLLPPRILRAEGRAADSTTRVPQQRQAQHEGNGNGHPLGIGQPPSEDGFGTPGQQTGQSVQAGHPGQPGQPGLRLVEQREPLETEKLDGFEEETGAAELLSVVGQLVERARESGELRTDVTVGDVLLVIATAAPSLPDAAQQAAASKRLLDILLEGLRSRPSA
ncbi:TetR/AcrR family transcriptional regulator [Streptomyces sp. NPDC054796]